MNEGHLVGINSTPLDAEEFEPLALSAFRPPSIGILEVDPLVTVDVQEEVLVFVLVLVRTLNEVNAHASCSFGPLHLI